IPLEYLGQICWNKFLIPPICIQVTYQPFNSADIKNFYLSANGRIFLDLFLQIIYFIDQRIGYLKIYIFVKSWREKFILFSIRKYVYCRIAIIRMVLQK